ncbi:hypothetical protein BDY21DRAFT_361141 [Lineolata rhizophorae]|uniref:GPI anchored protein n=1 Tax=Lineolata rhizophorae TaxID=578093 RepID=A0A6A6PBJ1_9PEZI|nr:hypothetical protein BDY21DRAFT_361141 [Lineolata rhizophorae]
MQIKTLALLGLTAAAASASPQLHKRQSLDSEEASILSVLATALPASLVSEALTNSAAVSSEIASQFAAGDTPSWFAALPTDVQTYLAPVATVTESPPFPAGNSTMGGATNSNSAAVTSTATSTTTSTDADESDEPTSSSSSDESEETAASSSSTGGASLPTAVVGYGVAGAMGVLGMLAL